ncbi:MAG: PQQ-binding-like beta-propeller repeat protein [Phycisphaera sp. RhM]|nr:PQQ-binding-like beta-propeller repeat protein [Phycisphaera sp. RhM]
MLQLSPVVQAEGWTSFRNGGGSLSKSPLPLEWSPSEGILWQKELIGYGQSAPVISDGEVFVTSVVGDRCETVAIECFDLLSGELRWRYQQPSSQQHVSTYMHSRAAPTPVVDDDAVYAFFETGDCIAVDRKGERIWSRNETEATGPFQNHHGLGASPAHDDNNLYLVLEHDGPSCLLAIEKSTGRTSWKVDRDSTKSWSSPIVTNVHGRSQVIVSSGGTVQAYSANEGNQLWQIDGLEGNSVPSPVVAGDYLLVGARLPEFAQDGTVRANCCIDLSTIESGKIPSVVWKADKAICDYASPIAVGNCAYFINKANALHCIDLTTGEVHYRRRLELTCWATPIATQSNIYFFGKDGQCKIVDAGPVYREVAVNRLWDLDAPPPPLRYTEATAPAHGTEQSSDERPGGGMVGRLLAGDVDQNRFLEGDEIPAMFAKNLDRVDTDHDGRLDAQEIQEMAKGFAERRKHSQASSRDPILYGGAASEGKLALRTGTRIYVIEK